MNALSIVDSHVHWWNPAGFRYAWLEALPALYRAFLPADYTVACAKANVDKLVFVESGCDSAQSLAEVDWASGLATTEPRLKGIVAHAPLEKGVAVRAELEALASSPFVKGVRRNLQGERDPGFCLEPEFLAGVRLLADFGFTADLCIRWEQLPSVAQLARRIPQVTFVLDHFGKPDVRNKQFEPWAAALEALASLPNVVCKISGLTTESGRDWQPADLRPYFDHALKCFGFDRVLFGGDWPVCTLATQYDHWVKMVLEWTASAAEAGRRKLFQSNAEKIYRL